MQFCRLLFACWSSLYLLWHFQSTESTEVYLEQNKALSVDSGLEKMWAVVMISWIIMYVKGKKMYTYIFVYFFSENKVYDRFYKITSLSGGFLALSI